MQDNNQLRKTLQKQIRDSKLLLSQLPPEKNSPLGEGEKNVYSVLKNLIVDAENQLATLPPRTPYFSRKQYFAIANVINWEYESFSYPTAEQNEIANAAVVKIVAALSKMFKEDNPNFDAQFFKDTCLE